MITHDASIDNAATPLYQQVLDDLKQRIESGEYPQGSKIAGEADLIKQYGVSRITIRRAVSELCSDGYLIKKQGVGTFVGKPRFRRMLGPVQGFSETCRLLGLTPSYRLNRLTLVPSRPIEREFLHLDETTKLICIRRTLSADNVPIMQETAYYPMLPRFQFLLEQSLEQPLYPLLNRYGIHPVSTAQCTLEIRTAKPELAESMQVPVGDPMFYKTAFVCDENGLPLYIERSYFVGSRYMFDISLQSNASGAPNLES